MIQVSILLSVMNQMGRSRCRIYVSFLSMFHFNQMSYLCFISVFRRNPWVATTCGTTAEPQLKNTAVHYEYQLKNKQKRIKYIDL